MPLLVPILKALFSFRSPLIPQHIFFSRLCTTRDRAIRQQTRLDVDAGEPSVCKLVLPRVLSTTVQYKCDGLLAASLQIAITGTY